MFGMANFHNKRFILTTMKQGKINILSLLFSFLVCLQGWGQTPYYVLDDANEYKSAAVSGTLKTYTLNGPGATLSMDIKNATAGVNCSVTANCFDENGENIKSQKFSTSTSYSTKTLEIPIGTKTIGMTISGSLNKYVRNVKVTRATTLSSSTTTLDFGETQLNNSNSRTISVDYNNTYPNTQLTGSCNNEYFSVTAKTMGETGNTDVEIKYNPKTVGIHSGTVTLTMGTASYQFDVTGYAPLELNSMNTSNYSVGNQKKVILTKTLPTGFSTIALPFNTTIDALAGSGNGKAYSLCNVGYDATNGYTFYFKEETTLTANKPYIIQLNSPVTNATWGETNMIALTASEITCGAWTMKANYTVGKGMNGLYGVVNSQGKIMKGSTNATLNAYTAYLEMNPTSRSTENTETIPDDAIPLFRIK